MLPGAGIMENSFGNFVCGVAAKALNKRTDPEIGVFVAKKAFRAAKDLQFMPSFHFRAFFRTKRTKKF